MLRSGHTRVLWKMKFAQCWSRKRNQVACRGLEGFCNPMETFLMRSKLAISALVVTSLFGSTLIASAQSQPAPGMSNDGTVSPGATSGKKTQHEKGMTTGSSTRSGTNKGGWRIRRIKTTLVPAPITWLLRKAAAGIEALFEGMHLREQSPGAIRGFAFSKMRPLSS